ncbi:MAG TPA: FAD-dependent oxidoreductase [Pyrinomonadaceae bacterium]|nr:FAD-dependent oxidoreductase [Pyrinomonadaceae bacterium]
MAKILILGGGFGGVVAAERLAEQLSDEHQITLVSRSRHFVFYPALVRLAFGKCQREDVSFNLRESMLNRRVNFIEAEIARIDPFERKVTIAHGEVEGKLSYDYLIFALGRRLATERITGFYENAHHLLNVDKALAFGKAITQFHEGRAVIGLCPDARLPVPIYETAFALSRMLEERGERERVRITIVSPDPLGSQFGDSDVTEALRNALDNHRIEFLPDFPINRVTPGAVMTSNGHSINFNLLMLVPPFEGSPVVHYLGITSEAYINVDSTMRVVGVERMYAVGDCVNFSGPKMGHMAVRQGEVAAANLAAEIDGHLPVSRYSHEMRLVIDEGGSDSLYAHKDIWTNEPASIRQGRFWSWAKRAQEKYWEVAHS